MTSKRNTDHVVYTDDSHQNGFGLLCRHCGLAQPITRPISLKGYVAIGAAFEKQHRDCPTPTAAPEAVAE